MTKKQLLKVKQELENYFCIKMTLRDRTPIGNRVKTTLLYTEKSDQDTYYIIITKYDYEVVSLINGYQSLSHRPMDNIESIKELIIKYNFPSIKSRMREKYIVPYGTPALQVDELLK